MHATWPIPDATPYLDNRDHLSDELSLLDLLLRHRVLQQRRRQIRAGSGLDPFRGLVVADEEIDELIGVTRESSEALPGSLGTGTDDDCGAMITALNLQIALRRQMSVEAGVTLALPALAALFGLSRLEEQILILCLAPELDRAYEKLYSYLQDDVTRKLPSVDLALDLLCHRSQRIEARLVFAPEAPLRRFRLLELHPRSSDAPDTLRAGVITLDGRIANVLLEQNRLDDRLHGVARLESVTTNEAEPGDADRFHRTRGLIRRQLDGARASYRHLFLHLHGPNREGARALALALADDAGWQLLIADARALRSLDRVEFTEVAWRLAREALLTPALLAIDAADHLVDGEQDWAEAHLPALFAALRACGRATILTSEYSWSRRDLMLDDEFLELTFPLPDAQHRERLWQGELQSLNVAEDLELGLLANTFRLTAGQIRAAAAEAGLRAAWRNPEASVVTAADLNAACRSLSNQRLAGLAHKLTSNDGWDDLILPPEPVAQLRQIVNHVRHKALIFGEWAFGRKLPRGHGLSALFAGPSGTGKTMAAGVIANELALDLYRIDLSQVVSKYIGETEKNLDRIFHEAETSNAILFFDEADALFGKRSAIKDAHDRYANIETSYLLQKMEEYEGLAILATNLRANLDEAFARRLRFAIEFPLPDEELRARIWAAVFPSQAPLAEDVDVATLARAFKVSGGNIANIALAAAFLAAEEGTAIAMPLILRAARREYQKIGRVWDDGASRTGS